MLDILNPVRAKTHYVLCCSILDWTGCRFVRKIGLMGVFGFMMARLIKITWSFLYCEKKKTPEQAKCLQTGETVAVKMVFQDKHYKNCELQIKHLLDHPNVLGLKHGFFSKTEKDELFMNLVLDGLVVGRNRAVEARQRVGASRTRQAIRDASNMLTVPRHDIGSGILGEEGDDNDLERKITMTTCSVIG